MQKCGKHDLMDVRWRVFSSPPGVVFFRHSADTAAFLDGWDAALRGNASASEQEAFSAVVRRPPAKPPMVHPANPHVFLAAGHSLPFGVLPVAGFLNGHTYFVQRLHEVRAGRAPARASHCGCS